MKVTLSARSEIGVVREKQQDDYIIGLGDSNFKWLKDTENISFSTNSMSLFVIADGMGGAVSGELASRLTIEGIMEYFNSISNRADNIEWRNILTNAIECANQKIHNYLIDHPESKGMGSTVTLGLIDDDRLHVSWVGDSRCYLFRNSELRQLTKDHSLVMKLLEEGEITGEEVFHHPMRNVITRSMGSDKADSDFADTYINPGDTILFCTDGLNSMLKNDDIETILIKDKKGDDTTAELISAANEAGGEDNTTVILLEVEENDNKSTYTAKHSEENAIHQPLRKSPLSYVMPMIFVGGFLILIGLITWVTLRSNPDNIGGEQGISLNKKTKKQSVIPAIPQMESDSSLRDVKQTLISEAKRHDTEYYIRVNTYRHEEDARRELINLTGTIPEKAFRVDSIADGLFELRIKGFKQKKEASTFILENKLSNAVVLNLFSKHNN